MSILYFAACGISCFGPIVAIYKGTQVCEQPGTRWLMAISALAYLLTQLVKAISQAFLRCIDFVGLCFTVHHKTALSFESNTRLLSVGLGWSLAHAVFTNLLPLLAIFRGTTGFQWRYIYGALAASSSIISWTALATLAFLMTRRRKQQPLFIFAADAFSTAGILCAVLLFSPFFCGRLVVGQAPASAVSGESMSWWLSLFLQTGIDVLAAAFTLQCYYAKVTSTLTQSSSTFSSSAATAAAGHRTHTESDSHGSSSRNKGADHTSMHD